MPDMHHGHFHHVRHPSYPIPFMPDTHHAHYPSYPIFIMPDMPIMTDVRHV